jgi:transcriptional regulator with AAA-type ATPase domain
MKNVYVTWHYTTHGTAYLKHILSQFYLQESPLPDRITWENLSQEKLMGVFDGARKRGFTFDEIVYLTAPQEVFDKLSSRRFSYRKNILGDEEIKERGLKGIFEHLIREGDFDLEAHIDYVQQNHSELLADFKDVLWRDIHNYPISEQVKWLETYSNFQKVYQGKLKVECLNIKDLRDESAIAQHVNKWLRKYFREGEKQAFINVSLGSSETQVVWHILAEAGQLPENTRFIKTYDDKSDDKNKRFKRFSIHEVPTNLISSISANFRIYEEPKSQSRKLVDKKMEAFLKSGFSILLVGERGTGKSRIAREAKERLKKLDSVLQGGIIEANCASFTNDSMAESELFGYKKGAFTDAKKDKIGLLESAENGILFLDEIHHLSKAVQAKLMKALQTDELNRLSIRKLGDTKETKVKDVRLIFATNKSVEKLRECLLPDFYDRIVQHVIKIPPLRETKEDRREDWKNVWKGLKLKGRDVPEEEELIGWINSLELYGNFRDLQKIAIYYNAFNDFDDETREIMSEKTAFLYAKKEFEEYHLDVTATNDLIVPVSYGKTANEMIADFQFQLQRWATEKWSSRKEAAKKLQVTEKTLNNWKNKKVRG